MVINHDILSCSILYDDGWPVADCTNCNRDVVNLYILVTVARIGHNIKVEVNYQILYLPTYNTRSSTVALASNVVVLIGSSPRPASLDHESGQTSVQRE